MIAFGVVGYLVYLIIGLIALVQYFVVLVRNEPNTDLREIADWANAYVAQILDFLAYRREEMPFPLGEKPVRGTTD